LAVTTVTGIELLCGYDDVIDLKRVNRTTASNRKNAQITIVYPGIFFARAASGGG
jgi:hypothetical protein